MRRSGARKALAPPGTTGCELDTGAQSEANLRRYRRRRYVEVRRRAMSPDLTLVYLRKQIAG